MNDVNDCSTSIAQWLVRFWSEWPNIHSYLFPLVVSSLPILLYYSYRNCKGGDCDIRIHF